MWLTADVGGLPEPSPAVPPPRGRQRDGRHVGLHAKHAPLIPAGTTRLGLVRFGSVWFGLVKLAHGII